MAASQPSVFNAQQFTDAGLPAASYRLYTFTQGTATHKAAYTDAAGVVPHTYTSDGGGGQYIALNSRGELPAPLFLTTGAYDLSLKTPAGATVWTRYAVGASDAAVTLSAAYDAALRADLASTATNKGSALIGWLRAATSAVVATVQNRLDWFPFNAFEFMTVAEIAAVQAYSFANDNTAALQLAINAANLAGRTLEVPAGGYKIAGNLIIANPATYGVCKIQGAGIGNPFAIGNQVGTQFRQVNAATTLQFVGSGASPTNIELEISGIGFYSTDTTLVSPVVYIKGFYGVCRFHHNVVYQAGVGAGLQIDYATTSSIDNNYFLNRDCLTTDVGASRVGIGVYCPQSKDSGLLSVYKNSSRGWLTGYKFGLDGGSRMYNLSVRDCECSTVYNGIYVSNACYKAVIQNIYAEGGDGGTFINDNGLHTTVEDCFSFPGFLTHILSTATAAGATYSKNQLSLSAASPATANAIGIDLQGTNAFPRTVNSNTLTFGGSGGTIAGVVGIKIAGTTPKLSMSGNSFTASWTGGAGTAKISNGSTGVSGALPLIYGASTEIPANLRTAVSYEDSTALTETSVVANVLALPPTNAVYITAGAARTVNSISQAADFTGGSRVVHIVTGNNNITFTDAAPLYLNGAFTGSATGGILTLLVRDEAGTLVGREISRTSF